MQSDLGSVFLSYQFKVALILAVFYLFYRLLMSKETFHRLNRSLLVGMLAISFVLPFCVVTIHRTALESAPLIESEQVSATALQPVAQAPAFASEPVTDDYVRQEFVAESGNTAQVQETVVTETERKEPFNWWLLALAIWFAGCVFHLARTVLSVIQVRRLVRSGREVSHNEFSRTVVVDLNISPFSWMGTIVISADDYESANRGVIIDHEMTHVRLGHSKDLILVDLLSAMQWFNPVTVMLRQDLQDVHEFQADGCVLNDGFDAKDYQYMLLGKVASLSGFSVTNHFKKENLSNRIKMMNRKDSKFAKAFKALYAPILTCLVIMSFAVTVYDCKPEGQSQSQVQTTSGSKRNVDVLRDSMDVLDAIYGQGKFNRFPWETGGVWLNEDGSVLVRTGDRVEATMKQDEVVDYLLDYKGFNTHRITIVLSHLNGDLTNTGLQTARPLVDMLNEVGIYTLVVKTDEEWREAYYSTYKYGRIYTWKKGIYELDYNDMVVHGTPKELTDWIKALDIEYMAFFPDETMPWKDASIMMKAAYERGSRTFSICTCERSMVGSRSPLASLLMGPEDNGQMSRRLKENGYYLTTVLPTKRDLDKEFKGKTVMDVERAIRAEYTDKYLDKAVKRVHQPQIYISNSEAELLDIAFGETETALIFNYTGLGRNVWSRPGDYTTSKLIADGKEYACIGELGLQNFADYPWVPEYEYANGSFCWMPEYGRHITTYLFEPVPADVKKIDLVDVDKTTGRVDYALRGINVSGDENLFAGINLIYTSSYMDLELPGTTNRNSVEVDRIEITPDETTVFFDLLVRADFSYMGKIGSDMTLVLNDGSKVSIKSASVPLDEDFNRGGDHMLNHLQLVFPTVEMSKLLPDEATGRFSKLEGTVCGKKIELPFSYMRVMNTNR